MIDDNGLIDTDIDRCIANASKAFGALQKAVFNDRVLTVNTKRLINYLWASAAGKACCKLLQDTSWDLETPEKAELGSDTFEQSLLPWLNVVKHETTQLLQCLN